MGSNDLDCRNRTLVHAIETTIAPLGVTEMGERAHLGDRLGTHATAAFDRRSP